MGFQAGHGFRTRTNSSSDAPIRTGRVRGWRERWLAVLAATTLFAGGIVVALPETAGAVGTLSGSLSGAASVQAGTPWVLTGSVINTGITVVNGVNTIGSTNRGHILNIDAPCQVNNVGTNATGYSILVCPDPVLYPSGFSLSPGPPVTAQVTIDTTGLEGQSITYTGHTNSPDIVGGRTPDLSATVNVTDPAPTVSITSPLDGHLLDNVNDTTLSATATAGGGSVINYVAFTLDGEIALASDSSAPYETTIPVHSLATGTHALTATVVDSASHTASDTISVTQGIAPTVVIMAPANNADLDTGFATPFRATATPSTDATVTSVDFSVDELPVASLDTPSSPDTYQTSIPPNSLSSGPHTLTVQVNDSHGESAVDSIVVTQPAFVGPTVTIKAPISFVPSFFDSPRTFSIVTALQSGDAIQSVIWDVDGTPRPGSALKPYPITIDPVTLGPGTHSLNVTVTTSRLVGGEPVQHVGSDTLVITVPRATLVVDDATPGDHTIAPLSGQFVPGPDPASDAAWVVPVTNTGDGTARAVTLDLTATDGTNPLSFDLPQMLPGCVSATVFGDSPGVHCTLADVGPGVTQYVSVRVPTNGASDLAEFAGIAQVGSSNADVPDTASQLATTTALVPQPVVDGLGNQIAVPETIAIATPTSAQSSMVINTTAPVSASNQVLIRVRTPRRVFSSSLAPPAGASFAMFAGVAATAVVPKSVAPPPVAISLSAGDPCSGCKGLPSIIGGDFSHFKDKAHPIKVTISTFLPGAVVANPAKGIVATVGELYFTGDNGTYQLTGPTGLAKCARNVLTKQFATPCHVGNPSFKVTIGGVIATDTFMFVGGDPIARRK